MNFKKIILMVNAALLLGGSASVRAQCSSTIGTFETMYSGQQQTYINCGTGINSNDYVLHDVSRKIKTRSCPACSNIFTRAFANSNAVEYTNQNNDALWDMNDNNYSDFDYALDAHWGAGVTIDYFAEQHGHEGYDGNNSELLIFFLPNNSHATVNTATWHSDNIMFIDDVSGLFPNSVASLDYIAHEFGHGVNKHLIPGGLITSNSDIEVKSVEEGLADIWGICVKNYINNHPDYTNINKDLWLHGEDVFGPGQGRSAKTLRAQYPITINNTPSPHAGGNIFSHWFYLLSTNHSTTANITLDQSIKDVADILYRALSHYGTTEMGYLEMREITYLAALDLHGVDCSIVDELLAAWNTVNVRPIYANNSGMLSDMTHTPVFRRTNYNLSGFNYNNPYLYDQYMGLLPVLLLENLDPLEVRNVNHLEYIGINSMSNNMGSFTVSDSFPVRFTSSQEITLSSDNNKIGWIKAGTNCLLRINSCGVSPPAHTSSNHTVTLPEPQPEEPSAKSLSAKKLPTTTTTAFSIYPNPSTGSITLEVEMDLEEPARVQIYDLNGQLLHYQENITTTRLEYDLSSYPAGVYTIQLTTPKQTYTRKVVLSH